MMAIRLKGVVWQDRLEPDLQSLGPIFLLIEKMYDKKTVTSFMAVRPACMSVTICVPGALSSHKKALNPMEPELKAVVNCYIGAGNRPFFSLYFNILYHMDLVR